MKGMRLARRMRPTIWPTRPKPAMTTWPSFSGGVSKSGGAASTGRATTARRCSSSSGVAAMDRVTASVKQIGDGLLEHALRETRRRTARRRTRRPG